MEKGGEVLSDLPLECHELNRAKGLTGMYMERNRGQGNSKRETRAGVVPELVPTLTRLLSAGSSET
jgi:hypothetical protein